MGAALQGHKKYINIGKKGLVISTSKSNENRRAIRIFKGQHKDEKKKTTI